jgi:hypothetical protein
MTDSTHGVYELIAQTSRMAARYPLSAQGTRRFLLAFAERFAFIRLEDVWNPFRFLKQMEGTPPVKLGTDGFKASLLDDANPARHYTAFVFVGYWLPNLLGLLVLWLWELAGAVRYGYWSQPDVRSGYVGFYHGRLIRRYGHTILPSLIARDLTEPAGSFLRKSTLQS